MKEKPEIYYKIRRVSDGKYCGQTSWYSSWSWGNGKSYSENALKHAERAFRLACHRFYDWDIRMKKEYGGNYNTIPYKEIQLIKFTNGRKTIIARRPDLKRIDNFKFDNQYFEI